MYFPEYDDEKEIGSSSLVDNDTQQMEEGTAEGNTFLGNLRNIWATIERGLDIMNDPFAGDDISDVEANNAYNTITTEYARLLTRYYNCGDDETPCFTPMQTASSSESKSTPPTGQSYYSQLTTSSFGSPSDWLGDDLNQEPASPTTPTDEQSWIYSSTSDSPPNIGTFGLTPSSGYSTPPLPRQYPGDKIDSGLSRASSASKSIIAEAFEEENRDDKPAIESVATSILSGLFRQEKTDVKKAFSTGKAASVYKLIAKILYKQKIAIDVRNGATRGKGNEWQMKEIWGSRITDFAKSAEAKCYLCGGQIVQAVPGGGGGRPEMEHKLPCAVFYAKFAFIYSCFANELTAWRTYVVNLQDRSFLMEYYKVMNSSAVAFNKITLSEMYQRIRAEFLGRLDRSKFDATNLNLFINFVLPAYLSEFAYSHHLCNQLKSNHDLSTEANLTNYYAGIEAILNSEDGRCDKRASKNLKPACIDTDICNAERNAILRGLQGKIPFRKSNVQAQMTYLDFFASKYAEESKTTEKRMILHTIKETIQTMQVPRASAGKVTKKEIKQMNVQARMIAQGLLLNTSDAANFLDQMNKDNITGTEESERLQNKARDRINIYLDRIHQIFENVYDTPENIKRQLKNTYVLPAIKIRIYNTTRTYYQVLKAIVENIDEKIDKLRITPESLGDNNEMLGECESFVINLNNDIIEKYKANIPEWQKPIGVARTYVAPKATERRPKSSSEKQKNKEANAMEMAEIQKPKKNVVEAKRKADAKRQAEVEAKRRAEAIRKADAIRQMEAERQAEAERQEAKRRDAIREREERATKNTADARSNKRRKLLGGRKTRKLKRRPRKTIKRVGQRKRTIKRKHRSRKNTRRR